MLNLRMPDINSVTIAGNLTSDPTLRETTNGTPVANFCIASNRKFKDNAGQWRENVCFVGVVAWYKLADSCYEYLRKGSAVLVEGELQSRTWKDATGGHNNVVEIKARRIQFLHRTERKVETDITEVHETRHTESRANAAQEAIEFLSDDEDTDGTDKRHFSSDEHIIEWNKGVTSK